MSETPASVLPTSGTLTGLDAIQQINAWLIALNTQGAWPSAPASPDERQLWLDTSLTPPLLKQRLSGAWERFGFSGFNTTLEIIDTTWNSIATIGASFFRNSSLSTPNTPTSSTAWLCMQMRVDANNAIQLAIRYAGENLQIRRLNNGTWSAWSPVFVPATLLGTVAQTGGVPTGAVIESGSNGNGTYVRFADGTQICNLFRTSTFAVNVAANGLFRSNPIQWNFPVAFTGTCTFTATAVADSTDYSWVVADLPTGADIFYYLMNGVTSASKSRRVNIQAVGRWF